MTKTVSLLIPCSISDGRCVQFGRKQTSNDPSDELNAAFTAESFLSLFGEDAASNLTKDLVHALSPDLYHSSFNTDAQADDRVDSHSPSPSHCDATAVDQHNRTTLHDRRGMSSASSMSAKSGEADSVSAQDGTYEGTMQYFFILARGIRRVLSAPAHKPSPPGAMPHCQMNSGRPQAIREHSGRQVQPKLKHRALSAGHGKTPANLPARSRPASAVHVPHRAVTASHGARPARPRSAVLMDMMSTQIHGPISVSQVLHGELADSCIHDGVQSEWGVPPLASPPGPDVQLLSLSPSAFPWLPLLCQYIDAPGAVLLLFSPRVLGEA